MQKNKKASSAILVLVILGLLSGLSIISSAENIPISEEGLEKIGLNKIRLESGIGVMIFDLSESQDRLIADGYLTISNTYNTSAIITCQVVTQLSTVDLDENGNPRIHKTISNTIIFKPLSDSSWIILEDNEATVNPYSIYNFRYKVDIPLDEETDFNADEGYLLYINVRKSIENATGVSIGINYNYKLFIIFTGKLEQSMMAFTFRWWMLLPIPIIICGILLVVYKQKRKKTPSKAKIEKESFEITEPTKPTHITTQREGADTLHLKVDGILERKSSGGKDW